MQQDLFSESKISEQRAPASRVSPYEVLKEERSKVEKIKESSLFGRETESREKNGEGAAFLVPGQKGQDAQPLTEYDPDEILKASTEYFGGDNICFIEWAENIESALPQGCRQVVIEKTGEREREITL